MLTETSGERGSPSNATGGAKPHPAPSADLAAETIAISSPISTGGGGEHLEQQAGAYALALLLARATAPVLLDSEVVEVHFQTRHLGWRTDDILLVAEAEPNKRRKLALQVKRSFTIAASDEECAKTLGAMWDDFMGRDRFDPNVDRLAIAVLQGTVALLRDFTSLLDCARASANPEDFERRLGLQGYLSAKAKAQNETVKQLLGVHCGTSLDAKDQWQFLRVLNVLQLDLGTPTAQTEAMAVSLLAYIASGGADPRALARTTWTELVNIAGAARQSAASYRRDDLPEALRQRHHAIPTADDRARLDLVAHGKTVRNSIGSTIGGNYSLDRAQLSEVVLDALQAVAVVVVSGAAGSGKSAVAKQLLDRIELERPVFAFQAVEFATPHINDTLSKTQTRINAAALLALLAAHDRTTILVEGAERLLEHSVRDAFSHLLQMAVQNRSLRLVITCRDYALDTVRSALLEPLGLAHGVVEVGPLSEDELGDVAAHLPALAIPLAEPRMRAFLRTPYLLDMATRIQWSAESLPENVHAFRQRFWREVVRDEAHRAAGMPLRREAAFIRVATKRATELRPYVQVDIDDAEALEALYDASLLTRSPERDNQYAPAHDVLEDWAIMQWLDGVASTADDELSALAIAVAGLPAIRRALRRWLGERFELDPDSARELVLTAATRRDLTQYFRDDLIVAALLSQSAAEFVAGCRGRVEAGETHLLRQLVQLLRVACKTLPAWIGRGSLPSTMLVPAGPAWVPVLELVADYPPNAPDSDAVLQLGLVEDWVRGVTIQSTAAGADAAGRIVSVLTALFSQSWRNENRERALKILLTIPRHAPAFQDIADRALRGDRHDRAAEELADLALSTLSSAYVVRDFPDFVIDLLRRRLLLTEDDLRDRERDYSAWKVDECFGMQPSGPREFFPASAIQGPFWALFNHHTQKAVELVLELSNHAAAWYGERTWPGNDLEEAEQITIDVPGYGPVQQWFNGRLYGLSRGMTVGPYALQSALMATETWLFRIAKMDGVDLEGWLLYILARGNSALTTSLVSSACIAYPERSGRAALALLSTKDLFVYDRHRVVAERMHSTDFLSGLDSTNEVYEIERRRENALPHRREDLETLAVKLQFTSRRDEVRTILDRYYAELPNSDSEDTQLWRLALHRMDVRKMRVETVQPPTPTSQASNAHPPDAGESLSAAQTGQPSAQEDQSFYLVPGSVEADLQPLVEESARRFAELNLHTALKLAAQKAWDDSRGTEAENWRLLLRDAQELARRDSEMDMFARGGPGIVAAVCVRDHLSELVGEERTWCIAQISYELTISIEELDETLVHSRLFGPDRAAAAVLPLLVAKVPEQLPVDGTELLVLAFTHPVSEVVEYAYGGAGAFLANEYDDLAWRCAATAAYVADVRQRLHEEEQNRNWLEPSPEIDRGPQIKAAVRKALTGSVEDATDALQNLRFDKSYGRSAFVRIARIVLARADTETSLTLVTRAASWLGETWAAPRRGQDHRNFHTEYDLSTLIARFVLRQSDSSAMKLCTPLIALAVTEPREAATFVQHLIVEADGRQEDSFWSIWQAFADKAVSAPWTKRLDRERPYEVEFINRLFLRLQWKRGTTHWARLDGNAHRIDQLATRMPPVPVCIDAYVHFLYYIGRRQLPGAFKVLSAIFDNAQNLETGLTSEVMFVVETLLGLFVYGEPLRLKRDTALRESVLNILDKLVAAGSSAAYRMRDDFVTPLGTSKSQHSESTISNPASPNAPRTAEQSGTR